MEHQEHQEQGGVSQAESQRNNLQRVQIAISAIGAAFGIYLAGSAVVESIRTDIYDLGVRITALEVGAEATGERFSDYRVRLSELERAQNDRLDKFDDELKEFSRGNVAK